MMNQLTVLKEIGVTVEFDGKTEDEIVEEAQRHVLASYMNYPAPYRFVVLPADLGSWDDSDPTTHTFLLYFLCDVNKDPDLTEWFALNDPTITTWITGNEINDEFKLPKIPDHKHFSNHPGYKLIRPQEFFKTYGCYTLMILRMVWHGFPDDHYDIPRLDTCKILWGHDLDGSVNRLTKDTIGPLVNKAINYIEGLSLPRRGSEMWLTEREAAAIKEFLHIPESCSALGKLYRYFDHAHWYWTCEQHAHRKHPPGTLEALVDFVHSCGGQVDTQLATLQVELYSRSQVDMLSTLLHNFKHRFHTLTLYWKDSSWQGLEDCLQKVATAEVRGSDLRYLLRSPVTKQAHHLQLDGVSCDIHPQGTPEYKTDIFASLIQNDRDLKSLTLLNYPQPQEQCAYFGGGLAVYCMHSKQHQQEEPKHWTEDLLEKVSDYAEAILSEDGYQDVSNIRTLRNYWYGAFDLQEGTLRTLQLYDISGLDKDTTGEWEEIKLLGVLGSLQMLTVDVDDLDTDEVVTRVVQASPQLQVLNISIQEGRALELVERSAINEWIQLLGAISNESATEGTVFYDLQLQHIEIHGSGVEKINLTHSSMLFIHRLVYTNQQIELVLENVSQEDKGDLDLVVESLRRFDE
ncbi:hypothetical protein BGZ81_005975 [Podila clonocystis]|nr:hypothetical protein BGZ81_005975 [Podila clonocystis]